MTTPRLFSITDANRMLPLVRSIVRDAVDRYAQVKRAIHLLARLQSAHQAGDPSLAGRIRRQDRRVEALLEDLQASVDELEDLGLRLRDYERGVVDFPAASLDRGQFIFYCWALGEDRVNHWHREAEGFRDRHRCPAAALG